MWILALKRLALRRWCLAALTTLCGVVACYGPKGLQAHPAQGEDPALFEAVLKTIAAEAGRLPIRVDPRPFVLAPGLTAALNRAPEALPDLSASRQRVLQRLGIERVDATVVGLNEACPGTFVIAEEDGTPALDSLHAGCPQEMFYVITAARPRAGSGMLPGGGAYDESQLQPTQGFWSVRVAQTMMSPHGANMMIGDYVMQRTRTGWKFVRLFLISWIE